MPQATERTRETALQFCWAALFLLFGGEFHSASGSCQSFLRSGAESGRVFPRFRLPCRAKQDEFLCKLGCAKVPNWVHGPEPLRLKNRTGHCTREPENRAAGALLARHVCCGERGASGRLPAWLAPVPSSSAAPSKVRIPGRTRCNWSPRHPCCSCRVLACFLFSCALTLAPCPSHSKNASPIQIEPNIPRTGKCAGRSGYREVPLWCNRIHYYGTEGNVGKEEKSAGIPAGNRRTVA